MAQKDPRGLVEVEVAPCALVMAHRLHNTCAIIFGRCTLVH